MKKQFSELERIEWNYIQAYHLNLRVVEPALRSLYFKLFGKDTCKGCQKVLVNVLNRMYYEIQNAYE